MINESDSFLSYFILFMSLRSICRLCWQIIFAAIFYNKFMNIRDYYQYVKDNHIRKIPINIEEDSSYVVGLNYVWMEPFRYLNLIKEEDDKDYDYLGDLFELTYDIAEWDVDSWIFDRGSDLLDVVNAAVLWIEDYERNR